MKDFDKLPKSLKKTIRYIKQDATLEQLKKFESYLVTTINERKLELKESSKLIV
jgi:hypothetical protein